EKILYGGLHVVDPAWGEARSSEELVDLERPGPLGAQHHAQAGADAPHLPHPAPIPEEIRGAGPGGGPDPDDGAPGEIALDDGGRALGDELALVDEAEAVAQLRLVHVVGGDHDGRPLVGQASDQPPEVPP